MGQVALTLKVMPKSNEIEIESIMDSVKNAALGENIKVSDVQVENMAFGLKALKVLILMPDQGGTDEIEEKLKKIDGVGEIETVEVTLI